MSSFRLEMDITEAFDRFLGDECTGPWCLLAGLLSKVVAAGDLTLAQAEEMRRLLAMTRGGPQ